MLTVHAHSCTQTDVLVPVPVCALCVQGDVVAVSPNFNHVLPQIFERPEAYEPDRFMPPRDEDKKKPFAYMGFGGGRHACIGQNFAYLQVRSPDSPTQPVCRLLLSHYGVQLGPSSARVCPIFACLQMGNSA